MVFLDLELSDCQIKMIEVVKTNDTGYSSLLFIFFFYVFLFLNGYSSSSMLLHY